MEEMGDDILKFFDDLDKKSSKSINYEDYKDSLLANLFSQVEFLKSEIKEKNYIIRNLLNRMKDDKCIIFPNTVSMSKDLEPDIETSSVCSDVTSNQNSLNDLTDNCNHQDKNSLAHSKMDHTTDISMQLISNEMEIIRINEQKINDQLVEIRQIHHGNYLNKKTLDKDIPNEVYKWPSGTILIAADSICNKLDEKRLSRNNRVKVRSFPGATINDMYSYIKPLLEKQPDYIILHISTNDAVTKTSESILTELLQLKLYVETTLPSCVVIISEPILRLDNAKANFTIKHLSDKLRNLNIKLLPNRNITNDHLSKRGLHLNERGTGRLALNIITYIRHL